MQAELKWLEDPEVFRVNRLDAHSDHHYYESREKMLEGRETLRQSLNGIWEFHWSENPSQRPQDFWQEGAKLEDFGSIHVPAHMEMQGYDRVHYINTMYPWEGHCFLRPPYIDWENNPVGSYVKEFDLEEGLLGKRVCISFQGVEAAMFVWLNGVFIGYAEDTFTPSEFDLTEVVREKGNRLCVEVYKKSSASWLEDQDFFRFSGIFREVYLYAKPEIHMEDLWIKTNLTEDYCQGTMEIEAKLSGEHCSRVHWTMKDSDGQEIGCGELVQKEDSLWAQSQCVFSDIRKWDIGQPNLYEVLLEVYNEQGMLVEVVPYRTGFRRFELKEKIMLLNGKRLEICGVNRHEWNPHKGRAISEEDMRADIAVFQKNNINAVRTSHYPNQSLWYQLCDEAGILVMDEMNLETHGSWQKVGQCEPSWNVPGSLPQWRACTLDRAASMLERDKNHPSILWWSCGNESYAGSNILAASEYFHKKDPSRLVHYEGCFWNREFEAISDVESRMYATPQEVREYLEQDPKKPFLLCEYMHDMGTSIGGMESYMKLFDEFPMYQGGFIWDYMDQAIYHKNKAGQEVLGYGGDFGDRPTDYTFCGNGIVFADRTEKPAMQEVRYWYGSRKERAEHDRTRDDQMTEACSKVKEQRAQKEEQEWPNIKVVHGDLILGVQGEGFEVLFSYGSYGPVSLVYDGEECLYRAPRPAFWRATTDNDLGNGFSVASAAWMSADQFFDYEEIQVNEYTKDGVSALNVTDLLNRKSAADDLIKAEIIYGFRTKTIPSTKVDVVYTVDGWGRIKVDVKYHGQAGLPQLPEFGMRFVLPYQEKIVWEGLSGETYPDRWKGGVFGIHESECVVTEHLNPQECGNHMHTCWMQIGKLRFSMDKETFQFSALPYTPQELENAAHIYELPYSERTVVSILAKMRGIGGIDSWGADVEEAYHISAEEDISYSFYMEKAI